MVLFITMYKMWCLLWHILHKNSNLTLGNGTRKTNVMDETTKFIGHMCHEPQLFV